VGCRLVLSLRKHYTHFEFDGLVHSTSLVPLVKYTLLDPMIGLASRLLPWKVPSGFRTMPFPSSKF
jgi:hypothetical protein